MLRATLISLSESRALRRWAEKSSLGQKVSGRFVAGTQLEDALRVTQSLNAAGMGCMAALEVEKFLEDLGH